MIVQIRRTILVESFTMGELLVDGKHWGWTLEDPVRERIGEDGRFHWRPEYKVPKQTAIPCGFYEVIVSYSNRFRRMLPLLLRVPDFDAIRIHGGNDADDTEGCPLAGLERDTTKGRVSDCAPVVDALTERIAQASKSAKVHCEVTIP